MYTDGVTDANNVEKKKFGVNRIVTVLNDNKDADPRQTVEEVGNVIREYGKDTDQFDDITMCA